MRFIILLSFFALFSGCNKPDPQPWLKDPVYLDMQKEKKETEAKLASQKESVVKLQEMFDKSIPQTGQAKAARLKLEKQTAVLEKIKQELLQQKLRLESRVEKSQSDYMRAFKNKTPWPDPKEFEDYHAQQALRTKSRNWKVSERIKEVRGPAQVAPKSGH